MRTAVAAGVDVCFANPGTTELDLVRAIDAVGGIRPVLGLFEGVCSGAADGYARMAGRPAMALLHLGPGVANAGANLHNARKAGTPMLVVVGDHATSHRGLGAPLESDVETIARGLSDSVRTSASAAGVGADAAAALAAGGVSTLIVPADCAWGEAPGDAPGPPPPAAPRAPADDAAVAAAERALADPGGAVLLLGGEALGERGVRAAGRIAAATGCTVLSETFPARLERGGGLPAPARLPYFPEQATAAIACHAALVLAGARTPVAFFKYPEVPSEIAPPGTPVLTLPAPVEALEALATRLGAPDAGAAPAPPAPPAPGPLTPASLVAALAWRQPEGAIVVDEGLTVSELYVAASGGAPRHTYLALTGGAIGQGPPTAVGAAVACPERPVLLLQADGSAMYTLQALWTMAHERLDVTTVVCANRAYRILEAELQRAGVTEAPAAARAFTRLDDPAPDWVALSSGMGVPAVRVTTAEDLGGELDRALAEPGPHLVEAVLA